MSSAHCRVCTHAERGRIEMLAIGGAGHVALAKRFGMSRYSVDRHMVRHVSPERRAHLIAGPLKLHELAEKAAELGLALVDYLNIVRSTLFEQFLAASEAGDRNGMGILSGRLLDCLKIIGQFTGDLQSAAQRPLIGIGIQIGAGPLSPHDAYTVLAQNPQLTPEEQARLEAIIGRPVALPPPRQSEQPSE